MKCIISFAAEGIIRDIQTNNISVFNILENVSSPGFPLFIQKIFFFSLLVKEEETENRFDFNLIVKNNEQNLIEIPIKSDFQDKKRSRQIVQIGGIPIPAPGILSFHLIKESTELCSYSIEIQQIGKPSIKKIEE